MLQLRGYQDDMINNLRQALAVNRRVLLQAPTGAGKTALATFIQKSAAERGKTSMFMVHQQELLSQTSKAFWREKLEHGMIAAGKKDSKMKVRIASVQTLVRRLERYTEPSIIIIDEAHRAAASTYQKILDSYPGSLVIGLTATPQRTDGKGLDDLFDAIVPGPSIRWLIDQGFLCDYQLAAPPKLADTSGIKVTAGEYNAKAAEEAVNKAAITGDAVKNYQLHASGKRCVVMCVSINHAEQVAAQYNAAGIPAAVIEGTMSNTERDKTLEDFSAGKLKVVCNVQLLIEGVDIPAIEVVQWLRPTKSLIVWMQGNGRGLRPAPGKDGLLILDHVGNWDQHGLPCEDREWTLEGKKKKKKESEEEDVKSMRCKECFHVFKPSPACPKCGTKMQFAPRAELEVEEAELQKIDIVETRKLRAKEQAQARGLADLVALGVRRNMGKPDAWAVNVLAAREKRKPTGDEFKEATRIKYEILAGANSI